MYLSEGIFDELGDFLKSKGILKTKWRGRDLKKGADGLNQMLGPMVSFKDDEMLRIVKILHKRDGDRVFEYAGWTNNEYSTDEYTFLDLAIVNNNPKSYRWLIDNVKNQYLMTQKLLNNPFSIMKKNKNWLKENGLELLEYLTINNTNSDASYKTLESILFKLYEDVAIDGNSWLTFNEQIDGILETKSEIVRDILTMFGNRFIRNDDLDYVKWFLQYYNFKDKESNIIKFAPKNGKINDYLNDDQEIVEYATSNAKKLGIRIEDWVPDEAKDIFLF